MTVVTISPSYGAGGSAIGPRAARRLGVPFVDPAIPVAVAQDLAISFEEASAVEQNAPSRLDLRVDVASGEGDGGRFADHADALHVRLDGAPEGRIQAAMRQHDIDEDQARAAQQRNDKIRSGYVRHNYRADSASPSLYHVVLDTVRLGWEASEKLIVDATRLRSASR